MNWLIQLLRSIFADPKNEPEAECNTASQEEIADQTLEHAKSGYRNAQEVIKTIDAKTGVVTGLSTLSAGFLIAIVKWSIESPTLSPRNFDQLIQSHPRFACAIYVSILASLLCALLCLGAAVWSVVARDRPSRLKNRFTVLFPVYPEEAETEAQQFFGSRLEGMTKTQILKEYEDQLRIVGTILCRKIKFNRRASWFLLFQFHFVAVALSLIVFLYLLA